MKDSYEISFSQDGVLEQGTVKIWRSGEDCCVTLLFRGEKFEASNWSYFDAFLDIRRTLEPMGILASCYGGSLNAHPGGLAGRSSDGLYAYKMYDHRKATQDDLVHIFDTGDDVVPATASEQRARFENWILGRSLDRKWWQFWK